MKEKDITVRQCWSCGRHFMWIAPELGSGWFKCSKCGATWTEVPVPGASSLGGTWKDTSGILHRSPNPLPRKKRAKK